MRNISDHYLGDRGKDYISIREFDKHNLGRAWQLKNYFSFHIHKGDVVLDIGANDGFMLSQVNCLKKIGVEVNPHSLVAAPSNIEMHEDFTKIPDESIDVVISNHCLEHIPSPILILKDVLRVLKNRGKLVLVTPLDDMHRDWEYGDEDHHLYTWTPVNIGNLLTEAGFEVQEVKLCRVAWSPKLFPLLRFEKLFIIACKMLSRIKRRQEVYAVAFKK